MRKKNNDRSDNTDAQPMENNFPVKTKIYSILAVAACATGAVLYALAFTPVSVYGIIGGIIAEIAALGLNKTQKKRNRVAMCKIIDIVSYVLLATGILIIIGGIIYNSTLS